MVTRLGYVLVSGIPQMFSTLNSDLAQYWPSYAPNSVFFGKKRAPSDQLLTTCDFEFETLVADSILRRWSPNLDMT